PPPDRPGAAHVSRVEAQLSRRHALLERPRSITNATYSTSGAYTRAAPTSSSPTRTCSSSPTPPPRSCRHSPPAPRAITSGWMIIESPRVRRQGSGGKRQGSGGRNQIVSVSLSKTPLPLRGHPVAAYHSDQLSEHVFKLFDTNCLRRGHKNATPEKAAISAVGGNSQQRRARGVTGSFTHFWARGWVGD